MKTDERGKVTYGLRNVYLETPDVRSLVTEAATIQDGYVLDGLRLTLTLHVA